MQHLISQAKLPALLLFLPSTSSQPPGTILYVSDSDPTCAGQSPCFATIQSAVDAALSSDTIRILAGTYVEQILIKNKNNFAGSGETDRIVIEADPSASAGTVIIDGARDLCSSGYAFRSQKSKFITLRGLTITDAGGQAISLMGGNNDNEAIHIERCRIFGNGSNSCNGGITIARNNPDTLIANSLIYGNGRNGIKFIDANGGPHHLDEVSRLTSTSGPEVHYGRRDS